MQELNIEQRRQFLKNYDNLVELFGQDLVDDGLSRYTLRQLCDVYQIPLQDAYGRPAANVPSAPYQKPHIFLGSKRTYYRFVNHQGWEKSISTPVTEWQVPAQYQHLAQADNITRPALLKLWPWLNQFELDIYTLDFGQGRQPEFYVRFGTEYGGHRCFYVPIQALKDGDADAIVERNQTYLKWYTKSDDLWNRMKLDPVFIAFLDRVKEGAK